MNNIKLKRIGIAVSAACMVMAAGVSQAVVPNAFSNGTAADAVEVNDNFNYLDGRIDTHSLTPGPTGPQGPAGADGLDGAQGIQGPAGTMGIQGPAGTNGTDGATGPTGPQGIAGQNGSNGLNGLDGADGAPGADGFDGATGPTGPQGPAGADGVGVVFHSWAGFGSAAGWSVKSFIVTESNGSFDTETRTYVRTPIDATTGTVAMTRQRTLLGAVVKHQILHFNYDTQGENKFTQLDTYQTNTTVLANTKTITPGFIFRHNAMGVGMNWATASTIDKVDVVGAGAGNNLDFGTDSRSLLAVEDITVQGVAYTGCQKISGNRSAQNMGGVYQAVTWYCPNNAGMVKRIETGAAYSRMWEFDPTNSTAAP